MRDARHKLIEYCVKGQRYTQLFDLAKDPQEITNLAANPEHTETLKKLRSLLEKERIRLNDGNTPYELPNKQGEAFWSLYESTDIVETP